MKNKNRIMLLSAALFCFTNFLPVGIAKAENDITIKERQHSYEQYLNKKLGNQLPTERVDVGLDNVKDSSGKYEVLNDYKGYVGKVIKTPEDGFVEWQVDVKNAGLYNIKVDYIPLVGKGSHIERTIEINGKSPFNEATQLVFSRIWKDNGEITRDKSGNDIKAEQIEDPQWQSEYLIDSLGYYSKPFKFEFNKGINTIKLISTKEPMAIKKITFCQEEEVASYDKLEAQYREKGYKVSKSTPIKVQGEKTKDKSDPTLVPVYDRSTPDVEPYDISKIRLNMIGGTRWKLPGQWIEWNIDVPEDGLYQLNIKAKQVDVRDGFVNRRLFIDGKVPFKEVENLKFYFSDSWQNLTLQKGNKEPYWFYFEKGTHTIKLDVNLGEVSQIIRAAEASEIELNECYRKILILTSATPDEFRDYQIDKRIPSVIESFQKQSIALKDLSLKLSSITGKKNTSAAILDTLSLQLSNLVKESDTIAARLGNLKSNIGALGAWILATKEQPLSIDYIALSNNGRELAKNKPGFFRKTWHELGSFVSSFFQDYNTIGGDEKSSEAIDVWITSGRDQAQIMKTMINDNFTRKTGIKVNLKLVSGGVILPSTVAGKAPDVVMGVGGSDPVNYAMRKAVADLSQFKDFNEVKNRFLTSATIPFSFNNGVYALPETQMFPMLFYRKDILSDMNLPIPKTWDEVKKVVSELQKNYMNFGLGAGLQSYSMFLYQQNGELYKNNGVQSNIDSELGINVFKNWTELYTNYKLPLQIDFINRFRVGEIPIGITDYGTYNSLAVFAPELRGLWDFCPIPGTLQSNGEINRSVPSTLTGTIMMKSSKKKDAAWEYMKWLTSANVQVTFGREMESLMGAAARYPTANLEALTQIPWPSKDYKNLSEQMKWVKAIPEVPGGYFVSRHLDNAFKSVVLHNNDPREKILDYVRVINDEIKTKREEFGLSVK